jgi:predicted lipoprotein with Yx(FWY)xxD motif
MPDGGRNKAPVLAVDGAVPNNIREAPMISVPRILPAAVFALTASCYGSAALAQAPVKMADGILTNAAGMTLYTFDKDADGKSACNGPCAANWPPLMAAADGKASGNWTMITRDDGAKQWAYKGKPLYLWAKDQKSGDKTGDGFNNVWHVAKQ